MGARLVGYNYWERKRERKKERKRETEEEERKKERRGGQIKKWQIYSQQVTVLALSISI